MLTITALAGPHANAADFRTLDFNASCENVAALEAARGSMPFDERLPSGFQLAFRAREMDRDVVIADCALYLRALADSDALWHERYFATVSSWRSRVGISPASPRDLAFANVCGRPSL